MALAYKIDILHALAEKGYSSREMIAAGLGSSVIHSMHKGKVVTWSALEIICDLLECDLGDIIMNVKDPGNDSAAIHEMHIPRQMYLIKLDILKELLDQAGETRAILYERGMSGTTLKYIYNQQPVEIDTVNRLCEMYGCSQAYIAFPVLRRINWRRS